MLPFKGVPPLLGVFFSLNVIDLPEFFEDHREEPPGQQLIDFGNVSVGLAFHVWFISKLPVVVRSSHLYLVAGVLQRVLGAAEVPTRGCCWSRSARATRAGGRYKLTFCRRRISNCQWRN